MMKPTEFLQFPIWKIDKNVRLNKYAKKIGIINQKIKSLETHLSELNEEIDANAKRLNVFMNGILGIDDYDYQRHVPIVNTKGEPKVMIYPVEVIDNHTQGDELPDPIITIQVSTRKIMKIVNFLRTYNEMVDELNGLIERYEDLTHEHNELWQRVKQSMRDIEFFYDRTNDDEVEHYDEDKHSLFVIQDGERWSFMYVRNEDKDKIEKLSQFNSDNEED